MAAAVVVAALAWPGGVWERVSAPDLHGLYLPLYEASVRAIFREQRLPLWNPFVFCGMPLLGATHGAVLYPPMWLAFGLLPTRVALEAFYALHLSILAIGSVAYLQRYAVPAWAAGIVPSVTMVGLARAISGSGYDHPSFLAAMAWVPWMLVAADAGVPGALALVTALQWLSGYPDFALDTPIMLAVVVLVASGRAKLRALATVGAGVGLGTAIAAIQLLPLADAVAESARGVSPVVLAAGREAFKVGSLGELAHGLVARQGFLALALALAGMMGPRPIVIAWAAALVWALFAANPPFGWLYRVPPFSGIRFPFGWTGLAPFFLGCLAAYGAAALARRARPLGMALAAAAVLESTRILAGVPATLPERAPDPVLLARRAPVLAAARRPDERILSPWDTLGGTPLRYEIPSVSGWDPSLAPRRVLHLLQPSLTAARGPETAADWRRVLPHADVLAILGVGTVVIPPEVATSFWHAGFRAEGGVPPDDVLAHAPAVQRARLVHRVVAVPNEDASLARVLAHAKDAPHTVVLEVGEAPAAEEPPPGAVERIAIATDEPERVVLDVTAAAPGIVVLGDTWTRGWTAALDDGDVPILLADHAFRAVAVGAGTHRIEMRYRPRSVRLGLLVSTLALFAALVLVATQRR